MSKSSSPFPLSDLQQAYWIGEQEIYHFNTPAYLYQSITLKKEFDIPRFENALLHVVRIHPALRTRILADGTQQVEAAPSSMEISITDLTHLSAEEEQDFFSLRKNTLESKLPKIESVLKFSCFIDRTRDAYRIHFLFRLIALDGGSISIFLKEVMMTYGGVSNEPPIVDYEDFIHKQLRQKDSPEYQQSVQYWKARIPNISAAPDLPTVDHESMPRKSQFTRRTLRLDKGKTAHLNQQARKCGITMTVLICTAYVDVLRMWSRNPSFTLNMLLSQRPSENPDYARVLGNFSNTLLLEALANQGGFAERARALQQQLSRDIVHTSVTGVELIRSMHRTGESLPAMPIVFASLLGYEVEEAEVGSRLEFDGSMHTPQVWLDHQAITQNGQLVLIWDVAEDVFLPGVIDQMLQTYEQHLDAIQNAALPSDELLLPALAPQFLQPCVAANETKRSLPRGLLHEFFAQACQDHPEKTAIISAHRTLSYDELWKLTTRLAALLREEGIGRNNLVAILATRDWRQVAAAMSVVQSGGAYLPVSSDLPPVRKSYLIAQPGVKVLLTERALIQDLDIPSGVKVFALEDVLPNGEPGVAIDLEPIQSEEDLAYVIFTSGSTGQPKGVSIDHRGAVNTIQDVIARFGLTCDDRVIGISAFNFDLSVYDIFGTLGCGAALVLPPHTATPAPDEWARSVRTYGVTVWNSVPALLEMQLEFLGPSAATDLASLRLVMLSGDWIPVSLPDRLKKMVPQVKLVGMGGATEASIWSNYFLIDEVDPSWKSIPYGWPLSNQSFHVLGPDMRPAPVWVVGELYIGGVGLAQGYYHDAKRTAASFVRHPKMAKRLYRTGDLGRYHPSGYIEFLGRNDNQVKIRGFRIELGEIDTALERCPGIRSGAAIVRSTNGRDKQLIAFYVRNKQDNVELDEASIRQRLETVLPDYMVPALIHEIEQMPVTTNGKIDRTALILLAPLSESGDIFVGPRNESEKKLAELWKALLGCESIGVHDNFFAVGGTSLMAVRLLRMVEETFGRKLPLASLLRHSSVAAQAELLGKAPAPLHSTQARNPAVSIRAGEEEGVLLVVHPVGGNVLCYRDLIDLVPPGIEIIGLQSPGNGRPRTVNELAASYVGAVLPQLHKKRPLYLLGWSMGGVIAHEMTRQFESIDISVTSLTMIESWMGSPDVTAEDSLEGFTLLRNFVRDFVEGAALPEQFDELVKSADDAGIEAAIRVLHDAGSPAGQLASEEFSVLLNEHRANYNALILHSPGTVTTPVQLYRGVNVKGFPFLEPFNLTITSNNDMIIAMNEDHFTIVRRAAMQSIVANTFSTNVTLN